MKLATPDSCVRLTLSPDQCKWTDMLGERRHLNAIKHGAMDGNNLARDDVNGLKIHKQGAQGECATYVYLGGKPLLMWHHYREDRADLGHLPDMESRLHPEIQIDAKGATLNRYTLIVKKGGVKKPWIYVHVGTQFHPEHWLFGWAYGTEIAECPLIQPERPAHQCLRLYDMRELMEMVR